jgi:hypothetical protein
MNELVNLLAECHALDIQLIPTGDGRLTIDAPEARLTADLIDRLKTHKPELWAESAPADELDLALERARVEWAKLTNIEKEGQPQDAFDEHRRCEDRVWTYDESTQLGRDAWLTETFSDVTHYEDFVRWLEE